MSAASPGLRLALDLRSPFACLALEPSLAWARELGVGLDCLPFAGPVLRPPGPAGRDDERGSRHRRYRAEHIAREIETYAAAQGLAIREPYRDAPAEAAVQAWLWLRTRSPERLAGFLRELFRRYWALELDAANPRDVARLLGPDADACLDWMGSGGPAALEANQRALRAEGVFQTPAYLLEGEVFYGRQHLPMLRWMLEGRSGPVPI